MPENSAEYMFPTSVKEVRALGWDYIDIIIFSGDAFMDHPSSGTAMIARVLQKEGYRVAIVPQPNWRDDLRDFRKLGRPRLFFGVNSGAMDSMVNHYTAARRLRSDDAYTPGGKAGQRPDYAVKVYTRILKEIYPDVPVVIGGIEASLRRFAHYDYWKDCLMPSILIDSGADCLIYGMGERAIVEIARAYSEGLPTDMVPQTVHHYQGAVPESVSEGALLLSPFSDALKDKSVFVANFNTIEREANRMHPSVIIETYSDGYVVANPPFPPETEEELDSWYSLPFTGAPHPRYKDKPIPAFEMIKNSITVHRGCFGGCSFCTIAAHQGKFIRSRSIANILEEVRRLSSRPHFRGVISDIGAPTANMYGMGGKDPDKCAKCARRSCLYPSMCPNLNHSHEKVLALYRSVMQSDCVRKAFIGSGIRYDLFLDAEGFLDPSGKEYFEQVVLHHTSGHFKVAPEHTEDHVLKYMSKPPFALFRTLRREFDRLAVAHGLKYVIVPYFISSHPGCTMKDMQSLAAEPALSGIRLDQVQDFTPTPMTASSAMYYSCKDIVTGKDIFVEKNPERKKQQKSAFLNRPTGFRGKQHRK